MRRIAVLSALPLLAVGVLAGCSGSSNSSSPASAVTVTGGFGKTPDVSIPAQKAGDKLTVKTLVHGNGQVLSRADAFVGNYAIYLWSGTSHKLLQTTFKTGGTPTLFTGTLLPGLETALIGQKMGSRVLAVLPPKEGFGTTGDPRVGIKGTDTLVFVVDMIKGTGPVVAPGDTVVVQYVGAIWRNSYVFDSSWKRSQPFGFTIGANPSQVIPGWDTGLAGQTAGSRVLLVIPPADGYGTKGSP